MNPRKSQPKAKALTKEVRKGANSVWRSKEETPKANGWYITRNEGGGLCWRAWGHGAWWKQHGFGWVEWFDGNGVAATYDWMPRSRKSIDLNSDQLPDVGKYILHELSKDVAEASSLSIDKLCIEWERRAINAAKNARIEGNYKTGQRDEYWSAVAGTNRLCAAELRRQLPRP